MPNHDGGHYFLTCLMPVRSLSGDDVTSGAHRDRRELAQKLALLPTGKQTACSPEHDPPSPFAANTLNHFARFVIIDQPSNNGRVSGDAILSIRQNPLDPQPVDRLGTPFLLFAADIDAPGDGDAAGEAALRAYTDALWATMNDDLRDIFGHCVRFADTKTADDFHAYIKRCQIETTMPFNDYWPDPLVFPPVVPPLGLLKLVGAATGAVALGWVGALLVLVVCVVFGVDRDFTANVGAVVGWGLLVVLLLVGVLALLVYNLYRSMMATGVKPMPAAPDADLPSVLKSLFLQQHFTRFAIDAQGLSDAALHDRFGTFLGAVAPAAPLPRQAAGECRAPALELPR